MVQDVFVWDESHDGPVDDGLIRYEWQAMNPSQEIGPWTVVFDFW